VDAPRLTRFPHLSWLPFRVAGAAAPKQLVVPWKGLSHVISLTVRGCHSVRWFSAGHESSWSERAGTLHFLPADGQRHTFVSAVPADLEKVSLIIPADHLAEIAARDGLALPESACPPPRSLLKNIPRRGCSSPATTCSVAASRR